MKKTVNYNLKNVTEKTERNNQIIKLLGTRKDIDGQMIELISKRNSIDSNIDNLRIENEIESINSTIETAENIIKSYIKIPTENLTYETHLGFVIEENKLTEVYDQIFEFYGIDISRQSNIVTFGDLVDVIQKLK